MADYVHPAEELKASPYGRRPLPLLGRVVVSELATAALARAVVNPEEVLTRHRAGDLGETRARDLFAGGMPGARRLSTYVVTPRLRVCVRTEPDCSRTDVLLPMEL